MDLQGFGRILILLGLSLLVVGGFMVIGARLGLGSMPGNVKIAGQNWSCYVPIAASIVLSILLTIVLNVILRFFK